MVPKFETVNRKHQSLVGAMMFHTVLEVHVEYRKKPLINPSQNKIP